MFYCFSQWTGRSLVWILRTWDGQSCWWLSHELLWAIRAVWVSSPIFCWPNVFYHPSSGQVSIAFRWDPLHSDDDITQYMWHGPLQYMGSSLSHITICLHPSNLLLSKPTTHRPHHQLISTKLSWHTHVSWPQPNMQPPIIVENMWNEEESKTNEVLKGDKVPLGDK